MEGKDLTGQLGKYHKTLMNAQIVDEEISSVLLKVSTAALREERRSVWLGEKKTLIGLLGVDMAIGVRGMER